MSSKGRETAEEKMRERENNRKERERKGDVQGRKGEGGRESKRKVLNLV